MGQAVALQKQSPSASDGVWARHKRRTPVPVRNRLADRGFNAREFDGASFQAASESNGMMPMMAANGGCESGSINALHIEQRHPQVP